VQLLPTHLQLCTPTMSTQLERLVKPSDLKHQSQSKAHCVNQTVHQGVPGIASASSSSSGVEVLAKYLTRHTANPSEHTVASRQFHHVHKAGLDSAGTKHCPTYIHVLLRNISQGTTTTTRPWPNILEQTRYGRLDPT